MNPFDPFKRVRDNLLSPQATGHKALNDFRSKIFMADLEQGRLDWIHCIIGACAFECVDASCWRAYAEHFTKPKKAGRPRSPHDPMRELALTAEYNEEVRQRRGPGTTAERISAGIGKCKGILQETMGVNALSASNIRRIVDRYNKAWKELHTRPRFPEPQPGRDASDAELLEHSRKLHDFHKRQE